MRIGRFTYFGEGRISEGACVQKGKQLQARRRRNFWQHLDGGSCHGGHTHSNATGCDRIPKFGFGGPEVLQVLYVSGFIIKSRAKSLTQVCYLFNNIGENSAARKNLHPTIIAVRTKNKSISTFVCFFSPPINVKQYKRNGE